jgi:L-idonate 5-dehydrogenase
MTVRAVVAHGAWDLRVEELDDRSPAAGEVEVEIAMGGICGSDLHYFHHGGVGDFKIREPLVLGHEIAGVVVRSGETVERLTPGTRVAINPSLPCRICEQCRRGAENICSDARFLGSAARYPHRQGGFRERLVLSAEQCVALPDDLPFSTAVFAEPLAVAFHAVGRTGGLLGRRVLVSGAGPIGLLCALVAQRAGASWVTVTDILEAPLAVASRLGVDAAINVADGAPAPEADVAIEASGAPQALSSCIAALVPGGRAVLLGLLPPGTVPIAANRAVTREIEVSGSFRFTASDFGAALGALVAGLDVTPLLTSQFPISEAREAFETAARRTESLKVQIVFAGDYR